MKLIVKKTIFQLWYLQGNENLHVVIKAEYRMAQVLANIIKAAAATGNRSACSNML